eukprot:gb/GFBE01019264.1/.p1 GENE.gb/GFBE01019264.1/~~gb/GFBE01019264.1/.p1  ORF type:complete len:140 (+),score=13.24 gb/GFBE01019264.1/:1-420(+)
MVVVVVTAIVFIIVVMSLQTPSSCPNLLVFSTSSRNNVDQARSSSAPFLTRASILRPNALRNCRNMTSANATAKDWHDSANLCSNMLTPGPCLHTARCQAMEPKLRCHVGILRPMQKQAVAIGARLGSCFNATGTYHHA